MTRICQITFCLFCFSIPLSQYVSAALLIVAAILSLFVRREWRGRFIQASWSIVVYLAILILGLIYSSDVLMGVKVLERNLSFIALAIFLSSEKTHTQTSVRKYFYWFVTGLLLSCLIFLINAIFNYRDAGNVNAFFFYELTGVLNFQPTYFAYYLIFAITYGLYMMYYEEKDQRNFGSWLLVLFFFSMLLLTGGRTTFVCLLLVLSFFIMKYLIDDRSGQKIQTMVVVLIMLVSMFLINIMEWDRGDGILDDSWERMILWESAFDAIPNPILGVGTGDYLTVLNDYYSSHQMKSYAEENLNSHNQIIQLLFSNGMLGVLAFILLISHPLYLAIKTQNMLCILVMFPFIIYGITEVFLGRYQGVVFFAWLHQIFISWMLSDKPVVYSEKGGVIIN